MMRNCLELLNIKIRANDFIIRSNVLDGHLNLDITSFILKRLNLVSRICDIHKTSRYLMHWVMVKYSNIINVFSLN